MYQLTHKTLQLVVPQGRCPQAISHQSEESFFDLKRTHTQFVQTVQTAPLNPVKSRSVGGQTQLVPTCSVVSKMTSLELVGMAS